MVQRKCKNDDSCLDPRYHTGILETHIFLGGQITCIIPHPYSHYVTGQQYSQDHEPGIVDLKCQAKVKYSS